VVSEEAQRVEAAQTVADGLESLDLVFEERAQEDGSLYGAVTAARIALELQARGLEVEERNIKLPEPVKSTGIRSVRVELHPDVAVDLDILVAAVDAPEPEEEEDGGLSEEQPVANLDVEGAETTDSQALL
jgi:large subunit ribosomal protein L9